MLANYVNHIEESALLKLVPIVAPYKVEFKLSKPRKTKLGDYRHPYKGKHHIITVNEDLGKNSFLVTLLHELAHLIVWEKYGNKVKAHGEEWKDEYRTLLVIFISNETFSPEVEEALSKSLYNIKASSSADISLSRVLKKVDANYERLTIEDLDLNAIFEYNKRTFIRGKLMRKRYKCMEVKTRREYLFSPLAEVQFVEN